MLVIWRDISKLRKRKFELEKLNDHLISKQSIRSEIFLKFYLSRYKLISHLNESTTTKKQNIKFTTKKAVKQHMNRT